MAPVASLAATPDDGLLAAAPSYSAPAEVLTMATGPPPAAAPDDGLLAAVVPHDSVSAAGGQPASASSPAATPDDVLQAALTHDEVLLAESLAAEPEYEAPAAAATVFHQAWAPLAAMAAGRDPRWDARLRSARRSDEPDPERSPAAVALRRGAAPGWELLPAQLFVPPRRLSPPRSAAGAWRPPVAGTCSQEAGYHGSPRARSSWAPRRSGARCASAGGSSRLPA